MSLLGSVRDVIVGGKSYDDDDSNALSHILGSDKETKEDDDDIVPDEAKSPSTSWLTNENPYPRYHRTKELIDRWTAEGLSRYVSLPMICVLGDTSSGKSSVLSSLIGLELPSASTLTTKCPVLIQLKYSATAKATIHIQWHPPRPRIRKRNIENHVQTETMNRIEKEMERHLSPSSSSEDKWINSAGDPLPSPPPAWSPRILLEDLDTAIPKVIQEAQDLILEYRDTMVSPDTICVTMESPDCREELTLVDLPGLVQFQHTQEASLLSQVEQVVLEYVYNPRSILLPIVAAPTNVHNSKVLQWALEFDPQTTRTIPVLTKPDLIDPGSEPDVLELLQTSRQFQHGFYMVKNRGQASLDKGATIVDGLKEEQEYFQYTLPWNSVSKPCLGISHLRTKLASVLWQVMQDSLPDIVNELKLKCHAVQTKMDDMGAMYHTRSDQRKFYNGLSQDLVAHVRGELSGKGARNGSKTSPVKSPSSSDQTRGASQLHTACNEFYREIQSGSLATIKSLVEGASVLVSAHGAGEDVRGELVHIDTKGGFACVDFVDAKDHTTELLFDGTGYAAEQPDFEPDEVWSDGNRVFIGRAGAMFDRLRKLPLKNIRTDPSWLNDKIANFRTDDLACFVNVDMFQQIVADFVQEDFAPPCQKLVSTLEDILSTTMKNALDENLEKSRFPLLKSMVESICNKVSKRMLETAMGQVQEHLEVEEHHPYTQDEVLMQAMSQVRYSNLQADLELQLRVDQEGMVLDTNTIKSLMDKVFQKHSQQNWMAEQMEFILSCYGKVATQRVLDRTPQICWQACRTLPKALQEELGGVTDDILEACLWESPESRERYEELETKLKDLTKAMDVMDAVR